MNPSYPDILHQPHLVNTVDNRIEDGVSYVSFLNEVGVVILLHVDKPQIEAR